MPVVGRADGYYIDVLAIQQLTIISVDGARITAGKSLGVFTVDVGTCNFLTQTTSRFADQCPASAHANTADSQPIISRLFRSHLPR
jgi:hypothetical protein